ncbi:helix-turn-helix domain-containing protein [Granulicella arctica]|uniref:helix-turn-helix domain-containing protein n=1 Tax=Granulicella arctica TaxID=940613 RepID=UPI0021DF57E6|nr:helix-turn-helix domain-containing protein [Granulicella arctica]
MNFQHLHELLRLELLRRIDQGILTGTKLAQQTKFQQAHISNFLNKKRSLSLEGLDRVLAAQNLTVDQLLPVDLNAGDAGNDADPMETVPVVSSRAAMESAFATASSVIETMQVSASRLQDNRSRPNPKRLHWQRFLAIRVDAQQASAMEPMLGAGTIAVLDRHYNSLAPYRAHQPTLYGVRCGAALLLRFVDFEEGRMILRPYSRAFPIQLMSVGAEESPSDYIVGRVCILLSEL